jgi:hypothetical protein
MITENKNLRLLFFIATIVCFIAVSVCLICDISMNKSIIWSAYPFGGIAFLWVILSPLLLAKKNRLICALITLTIATMPLIRFLEWISPAKGWFNSLGLPISAVCIAAFWVTFAILKYLKLNKWYLSSIIVFIYGIVVSSTVEYSVSKFIGQNLFSFDNIINFFAVAAITVLLGVIGYYSGVSEKTKNENKTKE